MVYPFFYMRTNRNWLPGVLLSAHLVGLTTWSAEAPRNLALQAQASAFEEYQGMRAGLANDDRPDTRWSGVPGHNVGAWFELNWVQPVRVGEVVVFQYDRYVEEMDLQLWDSTNQVWVTLEHLGQRGQRLPRVVVCRFPPCLTKRVRLGNITNGPSFTEVQVFEESYSETPAINLASDVDGHFIGMISDPWGSEPIARRKVILSGFSPAGPWQVSAVSDDHGLFTVPMPLGMTGQIQVHAQFSERTPAADLWLDAAAFQYGLAPADLHRKVLKLEEAWGFAPDPPEGFWGRDFDDQKWSKIVVPAHFQMNGFQSENGVGGYRKWFRVLSGKGRLKLRFDGVYSGAEVWVNGQRLAYHEGGALPFEVDITEAVRSGENLLAVRVTEHTVVSDRLDKMSEYADFPLAGIIRPVQLFRVPDQRIGALGLTTAFDPNYADAKLSAHVAVLDESSRPLTHGTLEFGLTDAQGRPVRLSYQAPSLQVGAWQRMDVETVLAVKEARHWDAEHPYCYTLQAALKANGRVVDRVVQRVGFRQTELQVDQLFINGQPVKIRGTCHHDSYPLMGRAVTAELEQQDLELMKEANLNSLRTSHYPPRTELLDIADKLGLYVEDEGSFCWVSGADLDDLRLTPRILQLNSELLARDRNHPSVFMWSLCNESDFGYGFERSHEWMRRADSSRPDGGSYDRGSLELLARHNPITLADIAELKRARKPVLWDECWCIFQGIFGDVAELWVDPGLRDYYAEPLPVIYNQMMRSRHIAGTQIWAWSDDVFCVPNRGLEYGRGTTRSHFIENQYRLPGRGLVGDAPWGVVDGWRRQKPEFWITKKLHSPVKLREGPIEIPGPGESIRLPAENQYDFTALAELQVSWAIGAEHGLARATGLPHHTGEIELRPARQPVLGQVLDLQIHDPTGRLVDAYDLPFGHDSQPMPQLRRLVAQPLRITRESVLAGPGTRVSDHDLDFVFDDASGALRRGVVFGQAVLLELPRIHLLPAANPQGPLPDPLSWRLQKMEVEAQGECVRVSLRGTYDHLEGGYEVVIAPVGDLSVQAEFKYTGDELRVRELGIALSMPKECDELRWHRRAEWSVYPADHIGRPSGETRAFATHPELVPPSWPWALDNSPMGCNDFRSTKRHVHWASLCYPHGPGIWLESDGTQHVRAQVQPDRNAFYINDWYGGTHSGLWEWTSNYGEGKSLAPGETIRVTARLKLGQLQRLK